MQYIKPQLGVKVSASNLIQTGANNWVKLSTLYFESSPSGDPSAQNSTSGAYEADE